MSDIPPPLFLSESDVQAAIDMDVALQLAERGVQADGRGEVEGDKFYMPLGKQSFVKLFSGYLRGEEFAFVKTFSYVGEDPAESATTSTVLLLDAKTGRLVCVMEADWITGLKTGASTALTIEKLATPAAQVATVFGAGLQGSMHILGLAQRLKTERIYLIDARKRIADQVARDLGIETGLRIEAASFRDREQAVRRSDIVVTVTSANRPLVERSWLKPGAFVAKLGSYQEVGLEVITEADKVVVDRWAYLKPRVPELRMLQGSFGFRHIYAEWPDIAAGFREGRVSDHEIIVYLALGIWGEYAAILPEVYRRARELGLGQSLHERMEENAS